MQLISYVDLTGVAAGTVNVPVNYYTQYVSGPLGETYAVSSQSSLQVVSPTLPTTAGSQQLYAVAIQGKSSDYTLSGYYGVETLRNAATGQVISLSLPQPPAGVNSNYGIDLQFTDGSVSLVGNTSPSGLWTTSIAQGVPLSGNTQVWNNGAAVPVPTTGAPLQLGAAIAANPSMLNAADNSANVVFPQNYTVTSAQTNYKGVAAGDAFNATDRTLSSTMSFSDIGIDDSMNVKVLTGGFGAALNATGINTISVTNTTNKDYLLNAAGSKGITTVGAYQSSGSGVTAFGNLTSMVTVVADGTRQGWVSAGFTNSVIAANPSVNLVVTNGATTSFAAGSQDGSSSFTTINVNSQGQVANTITLINTMVNGVSGNATGVQNYNLTGSAPTALTVSYSAANGMLDASTATGRETLILAATATTVNTIKGSSAATSIDVSAASNFFDGSTVKSIVGNSGNDQLIVGQNFNAGILGASVITGINRVTGNAGAGDTRYIDASSLPGLTSVGFYDTGANGTDVANFVAYNLASGQSVVVGRAKAATINYGDTLALSLISGAGAANKLTLVMNGEILSTVTANDGPAAPISTLVFTSGVNNSLGSVAATLNAANTTHIDIVAVAGAITVGSTALNAGNLGSISVTGNSAVVIGGGASSVPSLSAIDSRTLTGDLIIGTLNYQSAASVSGGSGSNSIAWNFDTQGGATLDGGAHGAGSASRNTLVVSGSGYNGVTAIDLTQAGGEVITVNGAANSSIQKNFQNADATGIVGNFGVNVTASAQTTSITGSRQSDILTGNVAGGTSFNGNGGLDQITLGTHTGQDTIVASLSYTQAAPNIVATLDTVSGFRLDTATALGDIVQFGNTALINATSAAGWSVSNGIFSYNGGGIGGVAGFAAALASAGAKGVGSYYDGQSSWVVYTPDSMQAHWNVVQLVGVQVAAIDNNGVPAANAVQII